MFRHEGRWPAWPEDGPGGLTSSNALIDFRKNPISFHVAQACQRDCTHLHMAFLQNSKGCRVVPIFGYKERHQEHIVLSKQTKGPKGVLDGDQVLMTIGPQGLDPAVHGQIPKDLEGDLSKVARVACLQSQLLCCSLVSKPF